MENFDFISDDRFRLILERDFKEMTKCYDSGCHKSVLILSGSLIESLIVEFFINKLPDGYTENKILSLSLGELLELALSVKLINDKIKSLSTVVKNYRNLIHPGREIRLKEKFDKDTANVSKSLVNLILKEIKSNYLEIYGYSASDIINKITNDTVSIGIFEELVKKINYTEKLKLFNSLIDNEISRDISSLDNPKQYLDKLKPFINQDDLKKQLLNLHKTVESGETWEILILLNLFKENLNLLDQGKKELIIKYAISVLNKTKSLTEVNNLWRSSAFITLPKHIELSYLLDDYKNMLYSYYWGGKKHFQIKYLFDQLFSGLSRENKAKFIKEFEKKGEILVAFRFIDDTKDDLPF